MLSIPKRFIKPNIYASTIIRKKTNKKTKRKRRLDGVSLFNSFSIPNLLIGQLTEKQNVFRTKTDLQ